MENMEKLDPKNIENILALTPVQEGMLFHYLQDPQNGLYFEQLSLEISGEIDAALFEKAWNTVIESNEMLRTVYRWEKLEKPSQIILKEHKCKIIFHDLTKQKKPALTEIKNNDRRTTFDLHQVPFRVILCQLAEKQYEMVISNHHILYDGWSNGIILKEFFKAYYELSQGKKPLKFPAKPSFKEFIKWTQSRDRNKQEQFWRKHLAEVSTATELPIKRKIATEPGTGDYSIILDADLGRKLDIYIKNNRVTSASVFYTAWGLLLQKYSGGEDVIFGTTVSGRPSDIKEIENMVGLCINTIPLRIQTIPGEKLKDAVVQTNRLLQEREAFENTPLVDMGSYSRVAAGRPLFDTIMVIENYPLDNRLVPEGSLLSIHSYAMVEMTHYDLTVSIMPVNEIRIEFSFKPELFEKEIIENLAGHLTGIIQTIIENPETEFSRLEIITAAEKNRLLYDFNNTAKEYPTDKTIPQLFAEQASKTPDHIALVGADLRVCPVSLSYRQLNEHSNQLACLLIEKGVQPDNIVGIMMERSIEIITGILGILKSGGAYLPIDASYPQERIEYMLKDSGAQLLVTSDEKAGEKVGRWEGEKVLLEFSTHHSSFMVHHSSHSSHLAYIIYTSGSTGKPKGVMVQHKNVVNAAFGWREEYRLDTIDVNLLQMASFSFDVSCGDLCRALLNGGKLFICPDDLKLNFSLLYDYLCLHRITLFESTPSLVVPLMDYIHENRLKPGYLQLLIIGSDSFRSTDYQRLRARYGKSMRIINSYGVTEATIDSTYYESKSNDGDGLSEFVPIGRPMA
ncbi:MAG TPA: condensation domain-containing protein, partial [Candidatus Deferrimicrobium sp.]|nr:condensation domain-containing protein [Candidatus Deferrimicrobium sp.]